MDLNRLEILDLSTQHLAQANPLKHCEGTSDVEEIGRPRRFAAKPFISLGDAHSEEVAVLLAQALNLIEEAIHIHLHPGVTWPPLYSLLGSSTAAPLAIDAGQRGDHLALHHVALHPFRHEAQGNQIGRHRIVVLTKGRNRRIEAPTPDTKCAMCSM